MVQFYSEHSRSMRQYEQSCREANASNMTARQARWQKIEDDLVAGGHRAILEFECDLDVRKEHAKCLAEYDGISISIGILNRAKLRLAQQEASVRDAATPQDLT
jgi:hypothetical protein